MQQRRWFSHHSALQRTWKLHDQLATYSPSHNSPPWQWQTFRLHSNASVTPIHHFTQPGVSNMGSSDQRWFQHAIVVLHCRSVDSNEFSQVPHSRATQIHVEWHPSKKEINCCKQFDRTSFVKQRGWVGLFFLTLIVVKSYWLTFLWWILGLGVAREVHQHIWFTAENATMLNKDDLMHLPNKEQW